MKEWIKVILCMGLLACCIQAASAFSVKEISVPKADLKANDHVQMELEISIVALASSHDFQFSSDLKDTTCVVETYDEEINEYTNIQVDQDPSGRWLVMGWLLPSDRSFVLKVTFSGTVPEITSTENITMLRISELATGATIAGGEYKIERRVINPADVTSQIASVRVDLQTLRQTINTQAGLGIDTSPANGKLNEAENALTKADSLTSTSFSQALTQLDTAHTAIKDGYSLLDKSAAQYEIDQVKGTMSKVESLVTYFTVNRSISRTDARLIAITSKYDLASQSLSSANDMVSGGNYLGGKAKAVEASQYADDAYNLSTSMKADIGEGGFGLPGINPLFLALGIGVIVIGVVGYFAYRKFFHWDELG